MSETFRDRRGTAQTSLRRIWREVVIGLCVLTVTVQAAPVFTSSPSSRQVVRLGETLTLTATTSGDPAPSYQWTRNGVPIAGATSASWTVGPATSLDNGWYQVRATNSSGTAASPIIFINVAVPVTEIMDRPISDGSGAVPVAPGTPSGITGPSASAASIESRLEASSAALPGGLTDVTAVAAGASHGLALKSDGTVVAWGSNAAGESTVPAGLSNVVAIAAAENVSLALSAAGTVTAWGGNDRNQTKVPAGLTDVVAVATSGWHCLALRADGRVVAWGDSYSTETTVPSTLANVVAIAAGFSWSLALKADGTVAAWGGSSENAAPSGLSGVKAIAAGSSFGLAVKSDGTAVDWYRIGGTLGYTRSGGVPSNLANVVAVSSAFMESVALRADGTAVAWSTEYSGGGGSVATMPGLTDPASTLPSTLGQVVAIAAGRNHVVVLRDASRDALPVIVEQPSDQIGNVGGVVTFSVTAGGVPASTYQWYRNGVAISWATTSTLKLTVYDELPADVVGTPTAGEYSVAVTNSVGTVMSRAAKLTVLGAPKFTASAGARNVVTVGRDLKLSVAVASGEEPRFQWKHNGRPIVGATEASYTIQGATPRDGGWYQAVATNSIGATSSPVMFVNVAVSPARIVSWGGDAAVRVAPPVVEAIVQVVPAYPGGYALKADGTVLGWGGATVPAGLTDVVSLASDAVGTGMLALKSDGTVVGWGGGIFPVSAKIPADLHDVVDIKITDDDAFAVVNGGWLRTWGYHSLGYVPQGLYDIASIAVGSSHLLALKTGGAMQLWTWGAPAPAGLYAVPSGIKDIVSITAGADHDAVLTGTGKVYAWGDNTRGQSEVDEGLAQVVQIDASGDYTVALRGEGSVIVMGRPPALQTYPPDGLGKVAAIATERGYTVALVDASPYVAPVIATQPRSQAVAPGRTVTFTATVAGTGTGFLWEWSFNGTPIPGAASSRLVLTDVAAGAAGKYTVRVIGRSGSVTSDAATLTVDPALNPGHLVNLSVRSMAGSGAQALIVGLVIGGGDSSARTPLLIRGVGPSLVPLGVTGVLKDPVLRLYAGSTVIASNDDWLGDAVVSHTGAAVGAFSYLSNSSNDAALATQLSTGVYTTHVTGFDGGSGVTMAEIYDGSPAESFTKSSPRLLNISTRTQVGTGSSTLITGFVIGGATAKTVLIRAVGPTLANMGVTDALVDPKLDLYSGAALLNSNDNWGGAKSLADVASTVGAFALPTNSKDAALLPTLPPGVYTVHVSGVNGATGSVLVEVYDVP